ncbi:MAG: menaquinone biosynthesis decarboxylase [Planctomycetes bacterium]|nr:menaquinone biosynthesis decarboxylase [Planctomycetota bacterium]
MTYPTLRDFIDALDAAGELHRIAAPVSPILEITEITDRISKSPAPSTSPVAAVTDPRHHTLGGKALLFSNVAGSSMPLAINTFGSYRRMEMALGCTDGGFESLAERIGELVKPEPPVGIMEKMKKGLELAKIAGLAPKVVKSGLCQQVVKTGNDVNLFDLPIIKCWPDDGNPRKFGYPYDLQLPGEGRYITFGGVYTIHPDDAGKDGPRPSRNIGMYRAQLLDRNKTAMHWHIHHDGARHWRAWKKLGRSGGMPCAIAFGGESVLPYAATAPLPPGISELLMAGFLNQRAIELVPCKTIDLHVPANAEIVIEGFVSTECGPIGYDPRISNSTLPTPHSPLDPNHEVFEGPFGDHTGFYSLPDRYPLFTITAVTHRRNPIYPTTIVGLPPQEDYYMGKATERLFLPLLRTLVPDILDYDLPMFGACHNCAFIKIRKEYPLQARRVMHAIWGAGQMAWTKLIVVVDEDVNVHDHEDVLFHLCANCDPARDTELVTGPLDILDHAAPRLGAGHKMGFDATKKIPGEEAKGHPLRDYPTRLEMSAVVKAKIDRRWKEFGLD